MKNKIYDGEFRDDTFTPANKIERYSNEPVSIFDYDPSEVGVESLSLHDRTKKNIRSNPVVVEGFGKVDMYKNRPSKSDVDNSNRVVPGDPNSIKSKFANNENSILTPEEQLRYSAPLESTSSQYNTAQQIVMNGKPIVWQGGKVGSDQAQAKKVNNIIAGVRENCDKVRAPHEWKSFERTQEENKNLVTSAVPFEPWNANKMASMAGIQKFDPSQPYRPAQIDMSMGAPEFIQAPQANFKTFNRTARPFGKG